MTIDEKDMPLEEIFEPELTARLCRALYAAGIYTARQLLAHDIAELGAVPGVGAGCKAEILALCKAKDWKLKEG